MIRLLYCAIRHNTSANPQIKADLRMRKLRRAFGTFKANSLFEIIIPFAVGKKNTEEYFLYILLINIFINEIHFHF